MKKGPAFPPGLLASIESVPLLAASEEAQQEEARIHEMRGDEGDVVRADRRLGQQAGVNRIDTRLSTTTRALVHQHVNYET